MLKVGDVRPTREGKSFTVLEFAEESDGVQLRISTRI